MLKNRYDCVKALIDLKNTDINCKDDRGRSLVSCTLENLNEQSMENLKILIKDKKVDINLPDRDGWTPLHFACQQAIYKNDGTATTGEEQQKKLMVK